MTITVPTGAHTSACPPASQEGLGALLEFLPRRVKPGIRGLLSGLDPLQPNWGHVFLREEWLTALAKEWGIEPGLIRAGEQVPIRIAIEHDAKLGPRLVISICDNPTPAQASADLDLRRRLEEGGLWRPARAPEKLRQLYALTPKTGTGHWASLVPGLRELDENRIVFLSERPVDLSDVADVLLALQDAKEFVHWTGADAVLVATGDRGVGSRIFSDPDVVEAACGLGATLLTLAGPVPTLVDDLAWRSVILPDEMQGTIEAILRGELDRADRSRLDRIEKVLSDRPDNESNGFTDVPF
ncbi:hypothetical protein [Methylobacterium sp. CM6244]